MFHDTCVPLLLLMALLACDARDLAGEDTLTVPVDGLVLWLDASSIAEADGERLSEWPDRSGLKNDVSQDDGGRRPVWKKSVLGGQPAVQFRGGELLDRAAFAGFTPVDQPLHIAIVFQAPAGGGSAQRLIDLQSRIPGAAKGENQHGFWVGFQSRRYIPRLGIVNGDEGEASTAIWDSKPHLLELVYKGDQRFEIHIDGRAECESTYGGRKFLGFREQVTLAIGQHFGLEDHAPTYFHGDIAEVLVYRRALTSSERFELGSLITKKYSLETSFKPLPQFERDIRPILAANCFSCHGKEVREAGLDLRTVSAMLNGGEAGPVIVRGHPEYSELVRVLESGTMPPDDAEPLTTAQVSLLREWVTADTPAIETIVIRPPAAHVTDEDRRHWAWQMPVRTAPPDVQDTDRVSNDIDRFVLARLVDEGLTLSPDAMPEHLVRRAFFDLIGLPPSPAEIDEFLNDENPRRFERLVDRLLASQHFGERWGRHWLDVAGYVDVFGSDNDAAIIKTLPGKWHYRDYVIRSFNTDKPFDRFLVEQLAGDELFDWRNTETFAPEIVDSLIATTFLLSANDDTNAPELNTPDIRHHVLQRTAENVANSLLATTVQCCRCHDHKYEALSQVDYYRFQSIFAPVFNVRDWVVSDKRTRPGVSDTERTAIDDHNAAIDGQLKPLQQRRDRLKSAKSESEQAELKAVDSQIAELTSRKKSYQTIALATETATPAKTHVLRRGDYLRPGLEVEPELFEILLSSDTRSSTPTANASETAGISAASGRRLKLARLLTDPESLAGNHVARVFVNRLWQQLFGRGLVETSDNFGVSGSTPSHPKLLDWLTLRFIENGWRVKPLLRYMMLSSVYRQTAKLPAAPAVTGVRAVGRTPRPSGPDGRGVRPTRPRHIASSTDPENRLLWRMNLRRLDSEQLRDAILTVSGQLDRSLGGPPIPLDPRPDGMVVVKTNALPPGTSANRRSVYILARRNYHMTFLRVFDQPIVARNCAVRQSSAVVTQSLALLHNDFVIKQSAALAARVIRESSATNTSSQVRTAWRITCGRYPDPDELELCLSLLDRHTKRFAGSTTSRTDPQLRALTQLCHMLLNTNEFLYVP